MSKFPTRHRLLVLTFLAGLAACGGADNQSAETVKMKDLEVVDGTLNDGMTDLDGVQAEGTALIDAGGNAASSPSNAASANSSSADSAAPAEVVAEQ